MKRSILFIVCLAMTALIFSTCTREREETKDLEQIYREEGIPVRVKTTNPEEFTKEASFHSVLSGIKESSVYALLSDEVEKIYVRVGDYVQRNDVLLTFPTDNPRAKYYQAKVSFENAKRSYERMQNLYKDGGISRQELDNAGAAFEVAKADWDAVRYTVEVKAPISGYITKVNVRETDSVQEDDELFIIARTNQMKAIIWVSEKEIFDIKRGMTAYATWKGFKIQGKVIQVDLAMDQDVKAFQAVIELENKENILKPGTTADVHIVTYSNPEAIVVARKDILQEGDSFFVYLLNDGLAEKREVKLGEQHILDVEILEGLSVGDELVVEGQFLLEDGAKVKVVE